MERLNKVLAGAGAASRRGADSLIVEGRVQVNGEVVSTLGTRVDPETDAIRVDGRRIFPSGGPHHYFALNKPRGVVTTMADPEGRPSIRDLIKGFRGRIFPVGRLDYHSEGLLLLTDDGALARDLMRPGGGARKTYHVKVRGRPAPEVLERLSRGVVLDGRRTRPASFRPLHRAKNSWIEVTLVEGRRQQIRRMLLTVGHPVQKLKRVRYAGVVLGDLAAGSIRPLNAEEVDRLKRAVSGKRSDRPRGGADSA